MLDDGFEYVQPVGAVQSRAELLAWLTEHGYASKAVVSGRGGGDAGAGAAGGASGQAGAGGSAPSTSGRTAMWADRWSERELAPGVWLARYLEQHQPFIGALAWAVGWKAPVAAVHGGRRGWLQSQCLLCPLACTAAGEHTGAKRSGRWASVVLRQERGGGWRIAHIHETFVPQGTACA